MSTADRARGVLAWARGRDAYARLNASLGRAGDVSVSSGYGDRATSEYLDGSTDRRFTFSLNVVAPWSPGNDSLNADAMAAASDWMDWVDSQYPGNIPDMGDGCTVLAISALYDVPALAQVLPSGDLAQYTFQAAIDYHMEAPNETDS